MRLQPVIAMLALLAGTTVDSAERPLYIIFDGSNSMWGELDSQTRKIEAAKKVFAELDGGVLHNRELALRLYGHRRARDCSDTELAVPFGRAGETLDAISARINRVSPRGKTPITRSLKAALQDFGDRGGDILLISDGIETCDADPCELVRQWAERDIDVRVHVVGLGLKAESRQAMQCIAEASGSRYLDAQDTAALGAAIASAATSTAPSGDPAPSPSPAGGEFHLDGVDAAGERLPARGTLSSDSADIAVASHTRHRVPSGRYRLVAGVPTANGPLYQPVQLQTDIDGDESVRLTVELAKPPVIRTRFVQSGEVTDGALTEVFQNGQWLFNMRVGEDYYVLPGSYRFDSAPNQDNALSVTADIAAGDDTDIVFDLTRTAHTTIVVSAGDPARVLRQHQQLWQAGRQRYQLHYANGASVRPGTYSLVSEDDLTPYRIDDLTIPAVDRQTLQLTVPMAQVTLQYQFLQAPDTDDYRCFIEPLADGRRSQTVRCDGSELLLTAGRYAVRAWSRLGTFEPTEFAVDYGDRLHVPIQQIAW